MPNPKNEDVYRKIIAFRKLPEGWHYGEGVAPSLSSIEIALRIAQRSLGPRYEEIDAVPGAEGEIQLLGYLGGLRAEATIETNGKIGLILESDERPIFSMDQISIVEAMSHLEYWGSLWPFLSTLYTRGTISVGSDGSPALPSRHHRMAEFQQLIGSALPNIENKTFARIFSTFIRPSPENRLFSGNSSPKFSPQGAASNPVIANQATTATERSSG